MVHACCALLFRLGDHGASHAAVVVLPHAVEAVVVEVAADCFVIGAAGVAAERAAGPTAAAHGWAILKPSLIALSRITTAVAVAIDVQRAAELRDVIPEAVKRLLVAGKP